VADQPRVRLVTIDAEATLWSSEENGPIMDTVNVVVENPRGSANKYEYDDALHAFKLDRHLEVAMVYPAEYGFIPDTLSGDGDPLDVLVLTAYPTFPGCVIAIKILGMCRMTDENGPDFKLLGVPAYDSTWKGATDIADVPRHVLERIAHFFTVYKDLDEGKWSKVEDWVGRAEALKELEISRSRFAD
jgi:inorganic pyrophosphatase